MNKFEKVKLYYDRGLWDKSRVRNAAVKGWITDEEYETIIGEPYDTFMALKRILNGGA